MSDLAICYARLGNPFGLKGEFYDELGHRGADYYRAAGQPIIAYDDMVVEYLGFSTGLGTVVGLRRLNIGGFAGYAHVVRPFRVGTLIHKGAPLAWVAGKNDSPGTLWDGPHIHTTDSNMSAYAAAMGIRPLNNPAPIIARALSSSPAGLDQKPIEEEDDVKARFIVGNQRPNDWYMTDGFTKRHMAKGEADLMVALGLAEFAKDQGQLKNRWGVDILDQGFVDRIPEVRPE